MKRIILYMILLLLYCSYLFAKTDMRMADIVSPPNPPKKYESRKLKPVVTIENTGTEIINSLQIDYIVDVNNKNDSVEFIGPTTIWKGIFSSGQSTFIELKPFKHILRNGPHVIRVSIVKIGSKKIIGDPIGYRLNRKFIIENTTSITEDDFFLNTSNEKLINYTQQCENYLTQYSGLNKDAPFEELMEYFASPMFCRIEKIYNQLTENDKIKLKDISSDIEEIRNEINKDVLDEIDGTIAFMMPRIEQNLWEDLSEEELKEADIMIRKEWNSMRNALKQNDIDKAVSYFHHTTRDSYRKYFKALTPVGMQKISSDFEEIRLVRVFMNTATYEMIIKRKGEKFSHPLEFIKDSNGEWAIKAF